MVIRALAVQGEQPLLAELVRGLLAARRDGQYRNTQEGAWALLAFDAYRRVAEPASVELDAKLSLAGEELGSARFRAGSPLAKRFALPIGKVAAGAGTPLVFEKTSGGAELFYEARLRYARRELPARSLDAGFYVEKSLRTVRAEALSSAIRSTGGGALREVAASDLVLVDLTVVTPTPREFVVIDDPLPAGLEAINQDLTTTAAWLRAPATGGEEGAPSCEECEESGRDALAHGRGFGESAVRRELRDDRVLFFADHLPAGMFHYRYLARATTLGRFVVPPTRAEQMYSPEVFGRTAATELTVR
jgi:hypothetical protein